MNRIDRTLRILRTPFLALVLTAGFATLPAAATPAHAEAAAATATSFLRAKHEAIVALLKSNGADKDKKVDAELDSMVDYDQMAQDALGPVNWEKRTDAEKKEFKDLLHQLIQKNYKKRLMQTLDYKIDYTGEDAKGADFVVHTEAQNVNDKREEPTRIDYVVRKRSSGFVVLDLVPETSSVIKTYNKEFTKIIKDKGWDEVIKKMKDKLAKP